MPLILFSISIAIIGYFIPSNLMRVSLWLLVCIAGLSFYKNKIYFLIIFIVSLTLGVVFVHVRVQNYHINDIGNNYYGKSFVVKGKIQGIPSYQHHHARFNLKISEMNKRPV